mmetsp:Transcript_21802/g.39751  ORF Transcript_21802/g.39751 Transcript_21802/m.39751 type:complete len:381 (-) Transcript_21802:8-1150(-)
MGINMRGRLPLHDSNHEVSLSSRSSDKFSLMLSSIHPEQTWQDCSINTSNPIRLHELNDREELCCYDVPSCCKCDFYRERLEMCLEDIRSSQTKKACTVINAFDKFEKTPSKTANRFRCEVPALFPKDSVQLLKERLVNSMKTVFSGSRSVLNKELVAVDQVFNELIALKEKYEAPKHNRALSAPLCDEMMDHRLVDQLVSKLAALEKQQAEANKNENAPQGLLHKLSLEIAKTKSKLLKLRSDLAIKVAKENSSKANDKIEALNRHLELETQRCRSRTKLSFSRDSSLEKQPLSCDVTRDGNKMQKSSRVAYNLEQEKEAMRKLWKLMHKRIAHTKETLQAKRSALDREKQKLKEERELLQRERKELRRVRFDSNLLDL